jgi:hypothetical protein
MMSTHGELLGVEVSVKYTPGHRIGWHVRQLSNFRWFRSMEEKTHDIRGVVRAGKERRTSDYTCLNEPTLVNAHIGSGRTRFKVSDQHFA